MEDILYKYKERLINVSGRNRSLVTKKLYKKRSADLSKLIKFNEDIDTLILNHIMNREKTQLEILIDYITYVQNEKNTIQREIKKETDIELKKLSLLKDELESVEFSKRKKVIEEQFELKLAKEYQKVDAIGEEMADFSNSITQLTREIKSVEKETGRYELYIGYPFVEGRFKDSTFVKAPLFLFPVKLKLDKGNWYLENILDQEILLNKVFLLAASKYNKISIDEIETEFEDLTDRFDGIDKVVEYLGEYGIQIQYSQTSDTIKFKDTKKEDEAKFNNGELYINPYLILGQFPVANSIYDDYQELEKIYNGQSANNEQNVLLDKLLLSEDMGITDLNEDNEYYKRRPLKEEDYYFITALDYSQEKALKKVNETDQLVIYGPPGTGKSQTIANIISDALAKDKKILMVSQKRAALDVIYNRLNELNRKSIIIHDANKDKKNFYYKVATSIGEIVNDQNIKYSKEQILCKAKNVDKKIERLEALALTLSEKRKFGLTLQQMYSMSKEIDSIDDERYKEYRVFKNSNLLRGYSYAEIKDSINDIKSSNLINLYNKYKGHKINSPKILDIVDGLDKLDIGEYILELENVKRKYDECIYLKSDNDEYFDRIIKMYDELDCKISETILKTVSKDINNDKNAHLLNPLNKNDYIEQSSYKNSKYFGEFMNLYENIEDEIFDFAIKSLYESLNNTENKYLLEPLSKNDYINQSIYRTNEYFEEFIRLYDRIEDVLSDYKIVELAEKINQNANKHLLKTIDKESHKDKYEIRNKKHLDDFLNQYTTLEDIIDEDSIELLAKELTNKNYSDLLEPIDFGKWYTLSYWKNKKINLQKQIDNKKEYEKKHENITNLLNSYKTEIERYVNETKYKNKKEYEQRKEEIYNKFINYKNHIDKYVKETKINNKNEYDKRESIIKNDILSYKLDVDKYVEENKYKNKKEYERFEIEIFNKLKSIRDEIEELNKDVYVLTNIIDSTKEVDYKTKISNKENLLDYIDDTIKALQIYEEYHHILLTVNKLGILKDKILDYICDNNRSYEDQVTLIDNLLEFEILLHINDIEREEKLDILLYEDFNSIVKEVNYCLKMKQKLTPGYISNKIDLNFIYTKYKAKPADSRELERQANKKRQLWPIRQYLSQYTDLLLSLFPCWLLGPETVSEILPLSAGLFDIVIFDEASQMFIETAIPTVYRGKKVIIAGDDKQLQPSSTFKTKIEDEEDDDKESIAAYEEKSLLDLAKVNYDSVYLNYHYRSKYDELINFSNYAFYNGNLEVSPNTVKTDVSKEKPIERIKVDGKWIERKNIEEAREVFELVKRILMTRKNNETIGVITFNTNQQDLIEDLLDSEASKDPGFRKLYQLEKDRIENNEDVSLFVKNIENVQGDERDIIIFSTGYAPNEKGRVSLNFGSLSQDGGENRLNVAISRAKQKIYVVTSIEPEDLANVESTKNNGPKLLKKYLEYVRSVSNGDKEESQIILNSLLDSEVGRGSTLSFDSPFEEEVYEALTKAGFDVDTQIGVSGYKIDLGIYDSESSKYILGIECDGAAYHSSKSARERDIHRQRYLESRGWNIVRIWSRDWWQNSSKEIEKIANIIDDVKNNRPIREIKKRSKEKELHKSSIDNDMYVKDLENLVVDDDTKKEKIAEFVSILNNKMIEDIEIINQLQI